MKETSKVSRKTIPLGQNPGGFIKSTFQLPKKARKTGNTIKQHPQKNNIGKPERNREDDCQRGGGNGGKSVHSPRPGYQAVVRIFEYVYAAGKHPAEEK